MKQDIPKFEDDRQPRWLHVLLDSILALGGALLVTAVIFVFQLYPRIPNISLVYLLIVLALASWRGLYSAILASIVAFFSFDYFLVPPIYTLNISKFDEWLALFVFLVTAIITSQLASALRERAEQSRRREYETRILYELVRETNRVEGLRLQLDIIARAMVTIFSSWGLRNCSIYMPDEAGKLTVQSGTHSSDAAPSEQTDEQATASWVMANAQAVELYDVVLHKANHFAPRVVVRSTHSTSGRRSYVRMIPLKLGERVVGVLRLDIVDDPRLFSHEKSLGLELDRTNPRTAFFWTFVDQAASLIERERLRRESLQIEVLRRTDALRAALLSSVSHDLRTPLSSIKASATSLLEEDVQWDDEARRSFALTIVKEADRLNRLVANLLDMSRIEAGVLKPEKEWYPIDELIHDVFGRMQPFLQGRRITEDVPEHLPPVELDYLQIDQVLTNLLENVIRYTPSGSPIEICVRVRGNDIIISVADRGPGIPPGDLERIFDKFYRVLDGPAKGERAKSSGLGLAVCRGIVEAHSGRIWAENRRGGGAIFYVALPVKETEGGLHG